MVCARIFIKKEIREIMNSKRLLLSLFFGCFSCVIMNVISIMPGSHTLFSIDLERFLLCINYFVIYLCSDIIYVTMVEEVSSGTFDMILMSKCSKMKIVLLKCMLPVVISFVFFVINIFTNNVCALIIPQLMMLNVCDIIYWFFAVLANIGCNLVEFTRCISSKKNVPPDNIYITFFCVTFYAILFYISKSFIILTLIIAIGATLLIASYTLLQMKKIHITGSKRHIFGTGNIIKIKDGNYVKAIISRELKRFFSLKKDVFKIVYYIVSMSIIYVAMPQGLYRDVILCALIYIFSLIFSDDIFLESIKDEVYENMNEILMLAKIDRKTNYRMSMIVSLVLGLLAGCVFFGINGILYAIGLIGSFQFGYCILYWGTLIISLVLGNIFAYKYFISIKDVKLVKKYLYSATIVIYVLMCVMVL